LTSSTQSGFWTKKRSWFDPIFAKKTEKTSDQAKAPFYGHAVIIVL
jgi:hypothetical protein